MSNKPIIGITMGDGAGVGPEIIVRSLQTERIYREATPIVIGDAENAEKSSREFKDRSVY